MEQKDEMLQALELSEGFLKEIRKHPPRVFGYSESMVGIEALGKERYRKERIWEKDCNKLEALIKSARTAINAGFEKHWATVDDTRDAFYLAQTLREQYVNKK